MGLKQTVSLGELKSHNELKRLSSTIFTYTILEYFVPYANTVNKVI